MNSLRKSLSPRIYTYKVTFPHQGWWYWGVHKEKKYGEIYNGSPVTHAEKWKNFEFEKQILEFFDSYEEAREVEYRLIKQDLNSPMCLNEGVGGDTSINSRIKSGRKGGKKTSAIPGHMVKAGKAGGRVWTEKKRQSSKKTILVARQFQKDNHLQIYGDWEYYRRKGRLTRYGVIIDGIRIPAKNLSETFKEYHLRYGIQKGGYENP